MIYSHSFSMSCAVTPLPYLIHHHSHCSQKNGALSNAIWDKVGQKQTQKLPKDGVYILDGGT